MAPPKLIIFDCDGVLVDSEPVTNEFLRRELARYGLSLSLAECEGLFVGGTLRSVAEVAREMGARLPTGWADDLYARIYSHLENRVPLVAGVADVLRLLDRGGIAHCVVSNGSEEKMRITLGQNGLWERFSGVMFSAHRYNSTKPDPGLMLIAAAHFGIAPQDCLAIDDSPSGCIAAARAGMPCIGFAERTDPARLEGTGAMIARSMAEVASLITSR